MVHFLFNFNEYFNIFLDYQLFGNHRLWNMYRSRGSSDHLIFMIKIHVSEIKNLIIQKGAPEGKSNPMILS